MEKINICPICGDKMDYIDFCEGCWQVERNIDNYLKTKKGIKQMKKHIRRAESKLKKSKKVK